MHYFDYWTGRFILSSEMTMFNGGFFTFKIYYKFINKKKKKKNYYPLFLLLEMKYNDPSMDLDCDM